MAASYEARARGVHGGMGGRLAPALPGCGGGPASLLRLHGGEQGAVRPLRADRATGRGTLDGGGLPGRARARGDLRIPAPDRRASPPSEEEVGLAVTVGVARTKVLAKMASRAAKPDGLLLIAPADERRFLEPLPVERLWGWARRPPRGFAPAGSPRSASSPGAARKHSPWPWARPPPGTCTVARNRDPRPVRRGRRRGFGGQSALGRARRSPAELDAVLVALVDRVTRRMQGSRRAGRTVTLRLRFGDFSERAAPALFPTSPMAPARFLPPPGCCSWRRCP